MSRSGYTDGYDMDHWQLIRWRGAVASATKGARGQRLFKELLEALDAMPEKRLIRDSLNCEEGVCVLGALALKKGIDVSVIDPEDSETVAKTFDVATALAQEIVFLNDECGNRESPEQRWTRMRTWVTHQIK